MSEEPKINNYLKYSNMGIQMAVAIAAGVYGGKKLDEYTQNQSQLFTIIFSLIGVFAAIYLAIKDFINFKKK